MIASLTNYCQEFNCFWTFIREHSSLEDRVLHKEAWITTLLGTHLSIQVHKKVKFSWRDNSFLAVKGLTCTLSYFMFLTDHSCQNCHKNAHCDVDHCVCDEGFEGNGEQCRSKYQPSNSEWVRNFWHLSAKILYTVETKTATSPCVHFKVAASPTEKKITSPFWATLRLWR